MTKRQKELMEMPLKLKEAMLNVFEAKKNLQDAMDELEALNAKLSSDISLNPEKYGFPMGAKLLKYEIVSRVKSSPRYRELAKKVAELNSEFKHNEIEVEYLRMKFEALKCLSNVI